MMSKTLYCAISSHGFGHISQSAPILSRLYRLRPDINIIIQCAIDRAWLDERFDFPFVYVRQSSDFGMVMKSALEIDVQASHQAYLEVHEHWQDKVQETMQMISQFQPDLIYCNIAYLVNAAAARLSIPVINLCSLNWYQTYQAYCKDRPGASHIMQTMLQAYNTAEVFLTPEPSMSMPEINAVKTIGPVARRGLQRADDIRRLLGLAPESRLVLVSYGGLEYPVSFSRWPQTNGIYFLVSEKVRIKRNDFIAYESLCIPYIDILSSVDVIMTKSGYGTYVEAACNSIAVMYTRRPDWPEDSFLVQWLEKQANCIEVPRENLQNGDILEGLQKLLQQPGRPAIEPEGNIQASDELIKYLTN